MFQVGEVTFTVAELWPCTAADCQAFFVGPVDWKVHQDICHEENLEVRVCGDCQRQFWAGFMRHHLVTRHRYEYAAAVTALEKANGNHALRTVVSTHIYLHLH